MATDNGIKVSNEFEGHVLALSVLGLLRFGKLTDWNDNEMYDKIVAALIHGGDLHLIHALNHSEAFRMGVKHLEEFGEEEGKTHFQSVVTATVGAVLQEWGGTVGVERMDKAMRISARDTAMKELHGANMRIIDRVGGDAVASNEVLDAIRSGKAKVVELNGDGDIEEQLDKLGAPEEVKAALRNISEAVKKEVDKTTTKADEAKANDLRKQGRLN